MRSEYYLVNEDAWLFKSKVAETSGKRSQPEEVRQWCVHELLRSYGVCIGNIRIEQPLRVGTRFHRADIVVLRDDHPYIIIECKARKARKHQDAMNQAMSYATASEMNAEFAAYTNGNVWWVRRRIGNQWVPVSDLPTSYDSDSNTSYRDVLFTVNSVSPILYWLDKEIPAKQAPAYFGALQWFFHAPNQVVEGSNGNLLVAVDHVLRVLDDVNRPAGYIFGKFSVACDKLNAFWQAVGQDVVFGGSDFWMAVHDAGACLSMYLEEAGNLPVLDHQLMRLIVALLEYLNSLKTKGRLKYVAVGASVQQEVRSHIDLGLKLNFHSRLPDTQNNIYVQDIRDYCEPLWEEFLKG